MPHGISTKRKKDEYLIPQKLLSQYFESMQISYIDAYKYFADLKDDSKAFYLYIDSMHFSKRGHEVVFNILTSLFAN